jgi:hypothetical protein
MRAAFFLKPALAKAFSIRVIREIRGSGFGVRD